MQLDMTKREKVEAKSKTLGLILEKHGILQAPIMRVAAALDISGSMSTEYSRGNVQKVFDQLLGISFKFDDNGEIDIWKFDDRADYVGAACPEDLESYIRDNGIGIRGGTAYSPVIGSIIDFMFGAKSEGGFLGFGAKKVVNNMPALAMMITDGAPQDEGNTPAEQYRRIKPVLERAEQYPIYFMMVGVHQNASHFEVLERLADDLPNVGFVSMSGFNNTDEQLYEAVINPELIDWIKKFQVTTTA